MRIPDDLYEEIYSAMKGVRGGVSHILARMPAPKRLATSPDQCPKCGEAGKPVGMQIELCEVGSRSTGVHYACAEHGEWIA